MTLLDDDNFYIYDPVETDRDALQQTAFDYLEARWPDWAPDDGNLEAWIVAACANMVAEARDVAADVPSAIFRAYGRSVLGIPPIDPRSATVRSTWTVSSNLSGRTIEEGTMVAIDTDDSSFDTRIFEVDSSVDLPSGTLTTSAGGVVLRAHEEGIDDNEHGGDGVTVYPVDPIIWVGSVTLTESTGGGIEGESDDEYISRLSRYLTVKGGGIVKPENFEVTTEDSAERQKGRRIRTLALDGYDPDTDTYLNERVVGIAYIDDDTGDDLDTPTRDDLIQELRGQREINFVVKPVVPTRSIMDVTTAVKVLPGFDPVAVNAALADAIANYFNPRFWGATTGGESGRWRRIDTVKYQDVSAVVRNVQGVSHWTTLTIGINGSAQVSGDLDLPGAAPLTVPGAIVTSATL